MADRTRQEIFNLVVAHSRAQPKKAEHEGICVYLNAAGESCFMGALIPREKYVEQLEGMMMDHANDQPFLMEIILGSPDQDEDMINLLKDLQYTHDTYEPGEWDGRLKVLAETYNLEMPA